MIDTVDWLTGELTPLQQARVKLLENREWLDTHVFEIQRSHANQWIAVLDQSVAAAADSYSQVIEAVRERLEEAAILRIPLGEIAQPI